VTTLSQPSRLADHPLRNFLPVLWSGRPRIVLMAGLLILSIPLGLAAPILLRRIFDDALPAGDVRRMLMLGVSTVGLSLLAQVCRYLQGRLALGQRSRARYRLARLQLRHLLRLPLTFFHRHDTRHLVTRMRDDVRALDGLMPDAVLIAAVDAVRSLVLLGFLFVLDSVLALAGLALVVLLLGVLAMTASPLRRRGRDVLERSASTAAALHDLVAGIVTVRTTVGERRELRSAGRGLAATERSTVRRDLMSLEVGNAVALAAVLGTHSILTFGAYRVMRGSSTVGTLISFFLVLTQLVAAAESVLAANPRWQNGLAALDRIAALLAEPAELGGRETRPAAGDGTKLGARRGEVDFDRVSLAYGDGPTVLHDLTLRVEGGETVAVVGPSGAGKSSLVRLVPALLRPSGGRVRLGGLPVDEWPLAALRGAVGFLPQEAYLFNRSVRDNIALGAPGADDEAVRRAARAACAEEFILDLPRGYATCVGERGVALSGGQRQRIAIAREILRDPPLLILDEATAAVDAESEARIRLALSRLTAHRTCLLVAHRLSTVLAADRIAVLHRGRLCHVGTHAELLAGCSVYHRLYESQLLRPEAA
jgi:ABC-type multidrug transport system fused ATPase/permease subunit